MREKRDFTAQTAAPSPSHTAGPSTSSSSSQRLSGHSWRRRSSRMFPSPDPPCSATRTGACSSCIRCLPSRASLTRTSLLVRRFGGITGLFCPRSRVASIRRLRVVVVVSMLPQLLAVRLSYGSREQFPVPGRGESAEHFALRRSNAELRRMSDNCCEMYERLKGSGRLRAVEKREYLEEDHRNVIASALSGGILYFLDLE
ncbi:hypothetical protein FE257_012562 [Aspergillus nanangensis]|uniref:Uncharacterized protein n=1 Tax=Aspergillus nanangensis TaxID=2582783 RepID=A0AAD4CUV4_ASPNN|nr:hypothetical protein FE257_012562 [Aspergillus nanangensis]